MMMNTVMKLKLMKAQESPLKSLPRNEESPRNAKTIVRNIKKDESFQSFWQKPPLLLK